MKIYKAAVLLLSDPVAVGSQLLCQDRIRIPRIIHQLWMSPHQPGVTFQDREPERPDIVDAIRQWRFAALRDSQEPWQHQVWNRSSVRSVLDPHPHLADGFERLARWPERQKDFFMYWALLEEFSSMPMLCRCSCHRLGSRKRAGQMWQNLRRFN